MQGLGFSVYWLDDQSESAEITFDRGKLEGLVSLSISLVKRTLADPSIGLWEQTETEYLTFPAAELPDRVELSIPRPNPNEEHLVKIHIVSQYSPDSGETHNEAHYAYPLPPRRAE